MAETGQGMDFQLSDEQEALKKMVREFAHSEILPHVRSMDESQSFPRELMNKAAALGLLGSIFPEEFGGAGLSYVDYVTVVE